ncbi:MAG TPA: tetratricopeptide repeat protein [Caulobacter sp.]|nr:tetratricopeptide repeat protein [Caulobacter sp.]
MFARVLAAVAAVFLLAGLASPAEARWIRAESPRFVIYSDSPEHVARAYAEKMEMFDSLLRARHGLPENGVPARKLPIYLLRDHDDLKRTWHTASDTIGGYYVPGSLDTFAVAPLNGGDDIVVMHEYAHHFMLGSFPGAYPAWMVEGFAEYYSTTVIDPKFIEVGRVQEWRTGALLADRWIPMADLLANKYDPKRWNEFYSQSWLLTHYLMSDPQRFEQFRAYAALVAKGGDPVSSMTQATGLTPDALQAALKKYKSGGLKITQYRRPDFGKPPIAVTVLGPSADDLLLERLQLVGHHFKEADPNYLALVTRRAAKHPGDRLAVLTLGQAELELGDLGRARAVLEPWIKANPQDAEARFVLATHLNNLADREEDRTKAQALRDEARGLMEPAIAAAPGDYRILYAYVESRRAEGGYPDKPTLDILIRAYKQAPQVTPVRMELVRALMIRRHWREARALLGPVVNNPHGGEAAEHGRKLLEQINEAESRGG